MTMATISPSGREVSPAGLSGRSSRLVLLKFRLVAAAKPRKSSLLIFFLHQDASYSKRGGLVGLQAAHKPALHHQGGGGGGQACGALVAPAPVVISTSIFYIFP